MIRAHDDGDELIVLAIEPHSEAIHGTASGASHIFTRDTDKAGAIIVVPQLQFSRGCTPIGADLLRIVTVAQNGHALGRQCPQNHRVGVSRPRKARFKFPVIEGANRIGAHPYQGVGIIFRQPGVQFVDHRIDLVQAERIHNQLSVRGIVALGADWQVEARWPRADKAADQLYFLIGGQFLFQFSHSCGRLLDAGTFLQPVVDHKLCTVGVGEVQLIHFAEAPDGNAKQSHHEKHENTSVADAAIQHSSKSAKQRGVVRILFALVFRVRQEHYTHQRSQGLGQQPTHQQ